MGLSLISNFHPKGLLVCMKYMEPIYIKIYRQMSLLLLKKNNNVRGVKEARWDISY